MSKKEFFDNMQTLINDYMHDRKDKKDTERVKVEMSNLLDEVNAKFKNKKEKSELIEKQMITLDTMWINICMKRTWKELLTNTTHFIVRLKEVID